MLQIGRWVQLWTWVTGMHILSSFLTRTASGSLNSLRKSSSWVLEQQIFKLSDPNSRTRCGQTCWTSCKDSESAGTENQKKDVIYQTFFVWGYLAIVQLGNTDKLACIGNNTEPKLLLEVNNLLGWLLGYFASRRFLSNKSRLVCLL